MTQFWKNHEEDSIINELPIGTSLDNNNLIQMMKQKEVEKKFQEFFSFNAVEKINNQNYDPPSANNARYVNPLDQKKTPLQTLKEKANFIKDHKENNPTSKKIIESNIDKISKFNVLYGLFYFNLENALTMAKEDSFYDHPEMESSDNVFIKENSKNRSPHMSSFIIGLNYISL